MRDIVAQYMAKKFRFVVLFLQNFLSYLLASLLSIWTCVVYTVGIKIIVPINSW